jgi:hypothetical protein
MYKCHAGMALARLRSRHTSFPASISLTCAYPLALAESASGYRDRLNACVRPRVPLVPCRLASTLQLARCQVQVQGQEGARPMGRPRRPSRQIAIVRKPCACDPRARVMRMCPCARHGGIVSCGSFNFQSLVAACFSPPPPPPPPPPLGVPIYRSGAGHRSRWTPLLALNRGLRRRTHCPLENDELVVYAFAVFPLCSLIARAPSPPPLAAGRGR